MDEFTYIEAPNTCSKAGVRVFCAGGITNCPDWQQDLRLSLETKLAHVPVILFNPRRKNFPIGSPSAAEAQIRWEFTHLHLADVILFWFSRGSDNPIVQYEYGMHLSRMLYSRRKLPSIVCGVDCEYSRKADVLIQTSLSIGDNSRARTLFSGVHLDFLQFVNSAINVIDSIVYEDYESDE
jgi:hypothetical protein